jgi:hypothetical protein
MYRRIVRNQHIEITRRWKTSVKNIKNEADLKWTERKEAPRWLQKMAPSKGGRDLPTVKEAAVIGAVMAAGYYSWFIDPPKQQVPSEEN